MDWIQFAVLFYALGAIFESTDIFPFPCWLGKYEKKNEKILESWYRPFSESVKKEIELVDSQNESIHTFFITTN